MECIECEDDGEPEERCEPWKRFDVKHFVVTGAGFESVNGIYEFMMSDCYQGPEGSMLSFDGGRWTLASPANQHPTGTDLAAHSARPDWHGSLYSCKTRCAPTRENVWSLQEHGMSPGPTVFGVSPLEALEAAKGAGNASFKDGQFAVAEAELAAALGVAERYPGAAGITDETVSKLYGNRSESLLQLKRFEAAREDAEHALRLDPGFVKAHVRRAKALLGLGRVEEASQHLDATREKLPGNADLGMIPLIKSARYER